MTADRLRVALLGAGWIMDSHARWGPSGQLAEFVDGVAAGRQPRPSGEDGRVVMRVVEQAYTGAGP